MTLETTGAPARQESPSTGAATAIAPRCLSIDLEVGLKDGLIHQFAAVRGDTGEAFIFTNGDLEQALARLDDFADPVAFLLGHNLLAFDAPHLAAVAPQLRLLKLPMVDTLRLNPLAFPRHPYHHLVKHYKQGQLQRGNLNDPERDARLTLQVFTDQLAALREMQDSAPALLLAWHWLTTDAGTLSGLNSLFMMVRRNTRPNDADAIAAILSRLDGQACMIQAAAVAADAPTLGWVLAYVLAWLSVAGASSVMPPWVRHQFPQAAQLVRLLRDTACSDPACAWCGARHNPLAELTRWFPTMTAFRPEPCDAHGRPLQEAIVDATMRGRHVLGILPTGTGKSLCYQIAALSRYDKTGALTVVISPLVALMADQVAGLEARGIGCAVAINGLLSIPERAAALERVRLGDAGIVIVSPEQLRSPGVRRVLEQREIGAWVLDEAHCISKWGHDFRPDYRYVGRFIRERAGQGDIAPVLCLTATAKPDVVADMLAHFRDKVGIDLIVLDGGARRVNLSFSVVPTTPAEKFAHIHQLLDAELPAHAPGGAIVYCATKKQTEEVAAFLRQKEVGAAHFHAGLRGRDKKDRQQAFIAGELKVMVATNAFGMGIDKPDVRLVIHADIPGSLENYLQEAGRAGRDCSAAQCVLLYTVEDVERQFAMSARSRLSQQDIQVVLKAIKRLERKKHGDADIIATAGEILTEDADGDFARDSATDDTRVRTAIAWLEEARLLTREENQVQIFPSSLRVATLEQAREKLAAYPLFQEHRTALLTLVEALIGADADEGISTDELMNASGLSAEKVRAALYELEQYKIASNDTALTAFMHVAVEMSSRRLFEQSCALEEALLNAMREGAPDLAKGGCSVLHLRHASSRLKDAGLDWALPDKLLRIVRSIANDGHGDDGVGSLGVRQLDAENVQVTLQRSWQQIASTAALRRDGAGALLRHLLASLPPSARGNDQLASTTLGQLLAAIEGDLELAGRAKSCPRLVDRGLLWLHEQGVIRLNKGMAVFRPAMTIRLAPERRGFYKADFAPLQLHYSEQVVQIHVMAEYVQRGLQKMADALQLAMDYFGMERDQFIAQWLPAREKELERQTTPASWRAIVESLNNSAQQRIVADDRERTNVLALAGPGSGKTRVLVHRIAYLVRVRRENPRAILVLTYNRHAAVEIRRRLAALIGRDAAGVIVLTCHALAMRLAGISFDKHPGAAEDLLRQVIPQAVALLNGTGLAPQEADEQRDRLLGAFRWILVDEYQDIGPDQYALISALAGRNSADEDARLSLFAVGDDDQNIYAFNGASVDFIRRFEQDYSARPAYLTENYRSTRHIIDASNQLIAPACARMKSQNPIGIDRARSKLDAGGAWQARDAVGRGRVQIIDAGVDNASQALAIMAELQRLAALDPGWDWACVAVIAREWKTLEPVRAFCMMNAIPVQLANEETAQFWRLRETQALVRWLRQDAAALVDTAAIDAWLDTQPHGTWLALLRQAVREYALETGGAELPVAHFIEWLAEWGREARRRQTGLLLLTAHRAKGLEFDHVAVTDGHWTERGDNDDADAPRRLYYVAMTRARQTLTLARFAPSRSRPASLLDALNDAPCLLRRAPVALAAPPGALRRRYLQLTLQDVDISFVGRMAPGDPVHRAIGALRIDDPLLLREGKARWELVTLDAVVVGQLARSFKPPPNLRWSAGRVAAILVRQAADDDTDYRRLARCDQWEVVLPELVFDI
ncbi:RecQ family ATP-dependent DNA helicase [Massilia genomosp. 1]|uniref:DNA 3'-5' helicase n=1 Tax=Massilia genomosp. 1 TaxID=2609280 RepID=A0ABX0MNW9_9BURK|nr:RecQ family ATP-dependent DNA helicase [Massilia genomosp. 1]NHZ62106.1 RecQ family ATP-dependent DNA helicase [Massilia genomosp. 1]